MVWGTRRLEGFWWLLLACSICGRACDSERKRRSSIISNASSSTISKAVVVDNAVVVVEEGAVDADIVRASESRLLIIVDVVVMEDRA